VRIIQVAVREGGPAGPRGRPLYAHGRNRRGNLNNPDGTYLDEECCDEMRESGAILVPSRTIVEEMLAAKDHVPDYALAKLEAIADIHAQAVTLAHSRGVTIAIGSDIALTGPDLPDSWGRNGSEPGCLVKLGMTAVEAIEASSGQLAGATTPT